MFTNYYNRNHAATYVVYKAGKIVTYKREEGNRKKIKISFIITCCDARQF